MKLRIQSFSCTGHILGAQQPLVASGFNVSANTGHFHFCKNFYWTVLVKNVPPFTCGWGKKLIYIFHLLVYLKYGNLKMDRNNYI